MFRLVGSSDGVPGRRSRQTALTAWITRPLGIVEAVDGDAVEASPCLSVCSQRTCLPGEHAPLQLVTRRWRRPTAHQRPDHHAQPAEAEHLDLDRRAGDDPRPAPATAPAAARALDAEVAVIEVDRFIAGGRALYRQMQPQLRMRSLRVRPSILDRRGSPRRCKVRDLVHRGGPFRPVAALRIGIECQQHLRRACVGMTDAFLHRRVVEIQPPAEVARVGGVMKPR